MEDENSRNMSKQEKRVEKRRFYLSLISLVISILALIKSLCF